MSSTERTNSSELSPYPCPLLRSSTAPKYDNPVMQSQPNCADTNVPAALFCEKITDKAAGPMQYTPHDTNRMQNDASCDVAAAVCHNITQLSSSLDLPFNQCADNAALVLPVQIATPVIATRELTGSLPTCLPWGDAETHHGHVMCMPHGVIWTCQRTGVVSSEAVLALTPHIAHLIGVMLQDAVPGLEMQAWAGEGQIEGMIFPHRHAVSFEASIGHRGCRIRFEVTLPYDVAAAVGDLLVAQAATWDAAFCVEVF